MDKGLTLSRYAGNFLKKELRRRNISQEAFAERIGVTDRTVRRWINNGINSLENISVIAARLK